MFLYFTLLTFYYIRLHYTNMQVSVVLVLGTFYLLHFLIVTAVPGELYLN